MVGADPGLEGARAEIVAVAGAFADALQPALESALDRRVDALLRHRSPSLQPEVAAALRGAVGRAAARGATEVAGRLRDEDLWFSPRVVPAGPPRPTPGWSEFVPSWLVRLLRGMAGEGRDDGLGPLDDPGNRVWVAVLSAAKALDPVLEEFGLPPSDVPDPGGGHYGLFPRTATELDPDGVLLRLWRRYRAAYGRYVALRPGGRR